MGFKISNLKANYKATASTPQTLKVVVDCVNGLALVANTYILTASDAFIPASTKAIIIFTLGGVAAVFGFFSRFIAAEESGTTPPTS